MAIKSNELMIGSWVEHNANWCYRSPAEIKPFTFKWTERDWYAVGECTMSLEDLSPIELTPDILLKSGFSRDGAYWSHSYLNLLRTTSVEGREIILVPNSKYASAVKYVHQLQEIFHALTGEELKLEL